MAASYHNDYSYGIVIREKPNAQGLLRPMVNKDYLGFFNISNGFYGRRCQPLTDDPDEFVSLGCFLEWQFTSVPKYYPVDLQNLVGVHRSLCVHGKPGEPTRHDPHSWWITPQEDTLDLAAITCNYFSNPRYESIWLLQKAFIEFVESVNFVAKL